MSDDFGTVNVRRNDRAREIEIIRQRYRQHRETLGRLAADAPTEHLAAEYQRLMREIDTGLAKIDELEGRDVTAPGNRPLVMSTPAGSPDGESTVLDEPAYVPAAPAASSRMLLIVLAGVVVLGVIGWMIWRGSSDKPRIVTDTAVTTTTAAPVTTTTAPTITPIAPAEGFKIAPGSADYGTIRKGTRAVRQFEVTNTTGAPIAIKVARSACKCLFYDYHENVPAHGKETITVTVDGARAKVGTLQETVQVSSKKDPTVTGSFDVTAVIK